MRIRNVLIILLVMAGVFFTGCRSKRMNIPQAPAPAARGTITETAETAPILPTPPAQPAPQVVAPPEVAPPEVAPEPVPMREERVSFVQEVDRRAHDTNPFFVILGSFRSVENANRFKAILEEQGFEPLILISEAGLHRVSIDSFADETVARTRVARIRNNYPEYKDAWLLIRKR